MSAPCLSAALSGPSSSGPIPAFAEALPRNRLPSLCDWTSLGKHALLRTRNGLPKLGLQRPHSSRSAVTDDCSKAVVAGPPTSVRDRGRWQADRFSIPIDDKQSAASDSSGTNWSLPPTSSILSVRQPTANPAVQVQPSVLAVAGLSHVCRRSPVIAVRSRSSRDSPCLNGCRPHERDPPSRGC